MLLFVFFSSNFLDTTDNKGHSLIHEADFIPMLNSSDMEIEHLGLDESCGQTVKVNS